MKILGKTLMVFSIALGLGACHPDDGKMTAPDAGAGGAGGADAGAVTGPAAFLGAWQYQSTSKTSFTCSDGTVFDVPFDGTETETFTAGAQPNQLIATDQDGCTATCSVSGPTAGCTPDDACVGATITADVFTVAAGQLQESTIGSVTLNDGTVCQFSAPASVLVRIQ